MARRREGRCLFRLLPRYTRTVGSPNRCSAFAQEHATQPPRTFVNRSPGRQSHERHAKIDPPRAARKPVYYTVHGATHEDPYARLRASNWQEVMRDPAKLAPEIRVHLEAENAYSRPSWPIPRSCRSNFAEMKGRIKEEDSSVPAPDGPYSYLTKYVAGGQQPVLARTPREGGAETISSTAMPRLASGRSSVSGAHHSPDHRYLAWSFDERGSELYTIRIRDLETGVDLDDRIEGTSGRIVWSGDSRRIFYVLLNENHRPSKLYRHRLGAPVEIDQLVYEEADPDLSRRGSDAITAVHPDRQPRPRDLGSAGRPGRRARGHATAGGQARGRRRICDRGSAGHVLHPDQRRRRGGLQDRHGAGAQHQRPGELAGSGCRINGTVSFLRPRCLPAISFASSGSTACRASWCKAVRRCRARDRFRGGDVLARTDRGL